MLRYFNQGMRNWHQALLLLLLLTCVIGPKLTLFLARNWPKIESFFGAYSGSAGILPQMRKEHDYCFFSFIFQ